MFSGSGRRWANRAQIAALAVICGIAGSQVLAQETIVETVVDEQGEQPFGDFPSPAESDWEVVLGEDPSIWSPPILRPLGEDPTNWNPSGEETGFDPNSRNLDANDLAPRPNPRIQPRNGVVQPTREARSFAGQPSPGVDAVNRQGAAQHFPGYGLHLLIQAGKYPVVVKVDKDSAANQARLRKGDQLVSLNGRPATAAYAELSRMQDLAFSIRFLRKSVLKSAQLVHKSEPDFGYFPASRTGLLAADGGLKVVYTEGNKGLKRGDLIRSTDQQPIQSIAQLVERVSQRQGFFSVYFSRPGRKELFSVSLPVEDFQAFEGCSLIELEVLGATLENYFDFHRVVSVVTDSLASTMGLESGDKIIGVNGKQVSRIEDVIQEYENMQTIAATRGSSVMQFSPTATAAGRIKATLVLANFSDQPVQLFWKQPNGDNEASEKLIGVIPPNRSIQQPTFEDHQWTVRDPKTGDSLQEIVIGSTNNLFVVPPTENVLVLNDSGATIKSIANRRLLITNIEEDSLTTRFGLMVGDQLIKVNNKEANAFIESGEPLGEDSTLTVLLQGQGTPIKIKANKATIEGQTDYDPPQWVTESTEEDRPGGITVTQPQDGEIPSIAYLAAYHISEELEESQKLLRVIYYGTQVDAGRNHYLVCEMENPKTGEISVWNVEVYVDLKKKIEIRALDPL
jgi:C-terminal processing protease CtpA/Prc